MIKLTDVELSGVRLIGLASSTGPGSGKSTVAKLIQRVFRTIHLFHLGPVEVNTLSFASIIKAQGEALFGSDIQKDERIDGFDGNIETYRDILIALGESARRIYPKVWIHPMEAQVKELALKGYKANAPTLIIIDDVRKKIEIDFIQKSGGIVYNVIGKHHRQEVNETPASLFHQAATIFNTEHTEESAIQEIRRKVFYHGT